MDLKEKYDRVEGVTTATALVTEEVNNSDDYFKSTLLGPCVVAKVTKIIPVYGVRVL